MIRQARKKKLNLCLKNFFGIVTFTSIAAIALIITGITLSCFPKVELQEEIIVRKYVIDYTHCTPLDDNFKTCEDYFYSLYRESDVCYCFVPYNLIDLRGKITVHTQLEMSNQNFLNIGNSSVKSFADLISMSRKHCDPYTIEEETNDTCEAIPDEIYQDYIVLTNTETSETDDSEVNFSKSTRWGPAVNNSVNGFQNAISVLMSSIWRYSGPDANITRKFSVGNYTLTIKFHQNVNIWRRALVISTQNINVKTTVRSNVLDIVALVLGLVILLGSFALFALRKRITGAKQNNSSVYIVEELTPNNRISEALPEEKPLSPTLHNATDKEPVLNCNTPLDPTIRDAS